jgi:transposase-like protein
MQDITISCPKCESKNIVKRGKRAGKFKDKQLYECKKCGRRFTEPSLENMIHSPKVIYYALNCYHAGLTFEQSSKKVNRKFKVKTSKSTIHSWINMFQKFCPISFMRPKFLDHKDVLFTKRFEHENLDYLFMYHRYKIEVLARKNFLGLARYITSFEHGCPDVFFEVGKRCSKPMFKVKVKTRQQFNLACKMAGFAVQAAGNNLQRHKIVERFMLINDAATVACEVPVWYWDKKIDTGITGHIDMIQVRNGVVYIMDYKPNASKDKNAANQLYHYASALSYRTKIPLDKIRCAWFDEEAYFEYSPQDASVKITAVI